MNFFKIWALRVEGRNTSFRRARPPSRANTLLGDTVCCIFGACLSPTRSHEPLFEPLSPVLGIFADLQELLGVTDTDVDDQGLNKNTVRVWFRVRFQAVKVPIFSGFPVGSPTDKATASKLSKVEFLCPSMVRSGFRARLSWLSEYGSVACLLRRKTYMGNTGKIALGHRPSLILVCLATTHTRIEDRFTANITISGAPKHDAGLHFNETNGTFIYDAIARVNVQGRVAKKIKHCFFVARIANFTRTSFKSTVCKLGAL